MVDRKLLKNPNGLILGTPGSGKSFSAKREIANCFLLTSDDVIICDPEAEYAPLVERLHGQVIKISPTSANYINPMDLNLDYSDDESPLSLKSDFILSLCELIVGGKEGLQPVQKTIIDRCVRLVYQTYLNDPRPENMPILEDLYNLLREQEEKEAQYIATALEIYVTGSLNVFNHQSNVDIDMLDNGFVSNDNPNMYTILNKELQGQKIQTVDSDFQHPWEVVNFLTSELHTCCSRYDGQNCRPDCESRLGRWPILNCQQARWQLFEFTKEE